MAANPYRLKKDLVPAHAVQYLQGDSASLADVVALCSPHQVAMVLTDNSLLAPFFPLRPSASIKVKPNEWLVKTVNNFKSMNDTQFKAKYQPA